MAVFITKKIFFLFLLCLILTTTAIADEDSKYNINNLDEIELENHPTPILMKTVQKTIHFVRELKNISKESGDSLKLRCEVSGNIPATSFRWTMNGIPLIEEKNRIKIKHKLQGIPQWTQVKFRFLETLDTAYYECQASNDIDTIKSTAIVRVNMTSSYKRPSASFDDDDYDQTGLLPESYSEPDFHGSVVFEGGQKPPPLDKRPSQGGINNNFANGIPNLRPDEDFGKCQNYMGTVCSKYIGNDRIFISSSLSQDYIEQKLQAAFNAISISPDLSDNCSTYAIPSICLSTFPLCDKQTGKPRKLCREECEILESKICRKELAIARQHAGLDQQLVLPECDQIPPVGSAESANCVRLSIPEVSQVLKPHNCYEHNGKDYRGLTSTTKSGLVCLPWNKHPSLRATVTQYIELIGGHNYCRTPSGLEGMTEIGGPWCYIFSEGKITKEICSTPKCRNLNIFVIPAAAAIAFLTALFCCICCLIRRSRRKSLKTVENPEIQSNADTATKHEIISMKENNMEMNALIPSKSQNDTIVRAQPREFPINSIKFDEELGEGPHGKVFKGELIGVVTTTSSIVIKMLRPGSDQKSVNDFRREAELLSDIKHPNIVSLIGVCLQNDPYCMIFENLILGDLHEFLITHSPNIGSDISETDEDTNVLNSMDMSFIAIQIAAGMEYLSLSSHHSVHRDLAARNCLVGENLQIKISDFGLCKDIYAGDYYRVQSKSLLPVRWMPPESILYGNFSTESDVWSFGVVLWEIYSYGLQPYYGYSNEEVIDMIRSRQLLPCPEDCPSRMYAFMVECWHELPGRRPHFSEIHSRLQHWEGFSSGYQGSTTSHSVVGSHHSSTGPSNNTGSTYLSHYQSRAQPNYIMPNTALYSSPGSSLSKFHQHQPIMPPQSSSSQTSHSNARNLGSIH